MNVVSGATDHAEGYCKPYLRSISKFVDWHFRQLYPMLVIDASKEEELTTWYQCCSIELGLDEVY